MSVVRNKSFKGSFNNNFNVFRIGYLSSTLKRKGVVFDIFDNMEGNGAFESWLSQQKYLTV